MRTAEENVLPMLELCLKVQASGKTLVGNQNAADADADADARKKHRSLVILILILFIAGTVLIVMPFVQWSKPHLDHVTARVVSCEGGMRRGLTSTVMMRIDRSPFEVWIQLNSTAASDKIKSGFELACTQADVVKIDYATSTSLADDAYVAVAIQGAEGVDYVTQEDTYRAKRQDNMYAIPIGLVLYGLVGFLLWNMRKNRRTAQQ